MPSVLTAIERLEVRQALEELNARFTYHLDHNEVEQLVGLFAEDAYYSHGTRVSRGRTEIAALFTGRRAAGIRTARHLYSGLLIDIEDADHARGTSVCMTFAYDGPAPVRGTVPHLVADFIDRYRRESDGVWRFAERRIERIFVAPDNLGPVMGAAGS